MERKKICVFGSYVTDCSGVADHLPSPGETVFGTAFKLGPGGKGSNQAVAAHRAGADVTMVTKVGRDPFAGIMLDFYREEKMRTDYILVDDDLPTGAALICVDENSRQNQILVVPGACTGFTDGDIEKIRGIVEQSDILLAQFEVNMDALEKVMDIAKAKGVRIVLNPAPIRQVTPELLAKADIITPNEVEAAGLSGVPVCNENDAKKAADILHGYGVECVIITLGSLGVFASCKGTQKMVPALSVEAVDTTGAGDAFSGGLVAALSEGLDVFDAVYFGNKVAALSVTKFGTAPSMPCRHEIENMQPQPGGK